MFHIVPRVHINRPDFDNAVPVCLKHNVTEFFNLRTDGLPGRRQRYQRHAGKLAFRIIVHMSRNQQVDAPVSDNLGKPVAGFVKQTMVIRNLDVDGRHM